MAWWYVCTNLLCCFKAVICLFVYPKCSVCIHKLFQLSVTHTLVFSHLAWYMHMWTHSHSQCVSKPLFPQRPHKDSKTGHKPRVYVWVSVFTWLKCSLSLLPRLQVAFFQLRILERVSVLGLMKYDRVGGLLIGSSCAVTWLVVLCRHCAWSTSAKSMSITISITNSVYELM